MKRELTRRELYKRSVGHMAGWAIKLPICVFFPILLVVCRGEFYGLLQNQKIWLRLFWLAAVLMVLAITLWELYRISLYLADVLGKQVAEFEGRVEKIEGYPMINAQMGQGMAYLRELDAGAQKPKRFAISFTGMQRDENDLLFRRAVQYGGLVAFQYLKHTKCVINIVSAEEVELPEARPCRRKRKKTLKID